MANFTNIPFLNNMKWVPVSDTPGKNFDDDWFYNQIKEWEMKVCYAQKWQFGDTTPAHIISTIIPDKLKVYNKAQEVVQDFEWLLKGSAVINGVTVGLYEIDDISLDTGISGALPAGMYWFYQNVNNGGSYNVSWISEPVYLRTVHKNTSLIEYTHYENTQGVYFGVTDIVFKKRMECQLCEFMPDSDMSDYIDERHNAQNIYGQPFRTWKLLFANAKGMADYEIDLMNRILCLSSVRINGKLFTKVSGAKWEVQRTKGYPLAGWSIEVTETINLSGLQYIDPAPLEPGVVVVYDIQDDLYGDTPGNTVSITYFEQT